MGFTTEKLLLYSLYKCKPEFSLGNRGEIQKLESLEVKYEVKATDQSKGGSWYKSEERVCEQGP